jgi:hypothetical protein
MKGSLSVGRAGALIAAAAVLAFMAPAANAASASASVSAGAASAHDTDAAQSSPGRYVVDGARIRSSPSTSAIVVGYGYRSHDATAHCQRIIGNRQWTYHTNNTTGVTGWSRADVFVPYAVVPDC